MTGTNLPDSSRGPKPARDQVKNHIAQEFLCDAILFDLDGVLVDSTACVERHWTAWANQHGLDPQRVIQMAHGVRNIETMRRLAPDSDVEQEAADFAALEVADTAGVVAVQGAADIVQTLEAGRWAVVTSCSGPLAQARLRAAQLPRPPLLVTGDDVSHGKPEPDPYLLAASRLGLAPEECVVVEDARAGIQAGRAAGMRVVGIAATYAREELIRAGAAVVIGTLAELRVGEGAKGGRLALRFK